MLFWILAFLPRILSTSIPSGLQYRYNVSDLLALGFTQCYSVTYGTVTSIPLLRSACPDPGGDGTIFIGGQQGAGASRIILGAFAPYCDVFTETSSLSTATLRNGAYWYNYPLKGFGFAAVPSVTLNICDTITATNSSSRLCWHITGTVGGFRLGTLRNLNSNTAYYKVAYTKAGSGTSSCPTSPPTIAPSSSPTLTPSSAPSRSPTLTPSSAPTLTLSPTSSPTVVPSGATSSPTIAPSSSPTFTPSLVPTLTWSPTLTPTSEPTSDSTISPTLSTNPKSIKSSSKRSMKSTTIIALIVGIGGGCLLCCILIGLWYSCGKSGSGGKVYAEKTPEVMMT